MGLLQGNYLIPFMAKIPISPRISHHDCDAKIGLNIIPTKSDGKAKSGEKRKVLSMHIGINPKNQKSSYLTLFKQIPALLR